MEYIEQVIEDRLPKLELKRHAANRIFWRAVGNQSSNRILQGSILDAELEVKFQVHYASYKQ